jgi:hypothetical protein
MSDESKSAPPDQQVSSPKWAGSDNGKASKKRRLRTVLIVIGAITFAFVIIPKAFHAWHTVLTDDAYVNSYVTFVAPRVSGQVARVLVDNNNRVKKGDVLVELDPEPYRVRVSIKQAAVDSAQAELVVAQANVRSEIGQARGLRFKLQHAIENVDNQVAQIRARVATWEQAKATQMLAQSDFERAKKLLATKVSSKEEFDTKREELDVANAQVKQTLENVYEARAALGLHPQPAEGTNLADVPRAVSEATRFPQNPERSPRLSPRIEASLTRVDESIDNLLAALRELKDRIREALAPAQKVNGMSTRVSPSPVDRRIEHPPRADRSQMCSFASLFPSLPELIKGQIDDRRSIKSEHLRDNQAANDSDAKRLPQFAANAHADGERQRTKHRGHRGHHDWTKPDQARLVDRFFGTESFVSLGVEREIDHHDGVLFHDADKQDNSDDRDEIQLIAGYQHG